MIALTLVEFEYVESKVDIWGVPLIVIVAVAAAASITAWLLVRRAKRSS